MYESLRRTYYWPALAADCYATAQKCVKYDLERIKLRQVTTLWKIFPATTPLESVSQDFLGSLLKTRRVNLHLLVITDRFTNLTVTVPMSNTTALKMAGAFTTHWVFNNGPPRSLLTDNSKQLTSKFFQQVCQIIGIKNLFTTTYRAKTNRQSEVFNGTIFSSLRKYVGDHPTDWELYTSALTFAYNRQPHTSIGIPTF